MTEQSPASLCREFLNVSDVEYRCHIHYPEGVEVNDQWYDLDDERERILLTEMAVIPYMLGKGYDMWTEHDKDSAYVRFHPPPPADYLDFYRGEHEDKQIATLKAAIAALRSETDDNH